VRRQTIAIQREFPPSIGRNFSGQVADGFISFEMASRI
jgi:hypothetical protein